MSTAKITGYRLLGGRHPESATLYKILAFHGIHNPADDKPFTESLLFGLGGGIGFGYTMQPVPKTGRTSIMLNFQNHWEDSTTYITNICDRLGIKYTIFQSKSDKRADVALRDSIGNGEPVIYWIDRGVLPQYANLPRGIEEWLVNIVGMEGNVISVDDVSKKLFPVTHELVIETRKSLPSLKNQMLMVTGAGKVNVQSAVTKGLTDCILKLSDLNALPAIESWAELLTSDNKRNGWPLLFSDRKDLYVGLENIYDSVTHRGGGNLRDLFADFLDEAAIVLKKKNLASVAKTYRKVAKEWCNLGEIALTDQVSDFVEAKELITEKYMLFYKEGPDAHKDLERIDTRLKDITDKNRDWLPLSDEQILHLFHRMRHQVLVIYEKELEVLDQLKQAVK